MNTIKCSACGAVFKDYPHKYCRCGSSLYTSVGYASDGMPYVDENSYRAEPHIGEYEISDGVLYSFKGKFADIPEGVTCIAAGAFDDGGYIEKSGRSVLRTLKLPCSLRSIEDGALIVQSLREIQVSPQNRRFSASDGSLYIRDGTILLRYAGDYTRRSFTVPESVKAIGDYAFAFCENLDEVILPDGLAAIGNHAFEGCISLKQVKIPDGVTAIGNSVFEKCRALLSVVLPENLTLIGSDAFKRCESLAEITLPKNVESIGSSAFYDCKALNRVNLSENLQVINYKAFAYCISLQSIVIPTGVKTINMWVFDFCDNLKTIYCGAAKKPEGWQREWKSNESCSARLVWAYSGTKPPLPRVAKERETDQKVKKLQSLAEGGDVNSCFLLAEKYFYGSGVKRSYKTAFGWYKKAAEGNHEAATVCLGYCYLFSLGVERDAAEAYRCFKKAAAYDDTRAIFLLGYCYYFGINDGVNFEALHSSLGDARKAVQMFKIAAERGHANAQCWLAYCLYNGKGVEADKNAAEKIYEQAAKNGSKAAILWHMQNDTPFSRTDEGVMLKNNIYPKASDKISEVKKLAEGGDTYMQLHLAKYYEGGAEARANGALTFKCDKTAAEGGALAFKWYKAAAEGGDFEAMYKLSRLYDSGKAYYLNGQPDLRDHFDLSRKWRARAAEHGYWEAIDDELPREVIDATTAVIRDFLDKVGNLPQSERDEFWASGKNGARRPNSSSDDIDD